MGKKKNRCLKCHTSKRLTRHHILPKRHYKGAGPVMTLCRYCHDRIELLIPFEKMDKEFYYLVAEQFGYGRDQ